MRTMRPHVICTSHSAQNKLEKTEMEEALFLLKLWIVIGIVISIPILWVVGIARSIKLIRIGKKLRDRMIDILVLVKVQM